MQMEDTQSGSIFLVSSLSYVLILLLSFVWLLCSSEFNGCREGFVNRAKTYRTRLYKLFEIPVTPKASPHALLGSDTLLKLTLVSLHSTSSQAHLEASRD